MQSEAHRSWLTSVFVDVVKEGRYAPLVHAVVVRAHEQPIYRQEILYAVLLKEERLAGWLNRKEQI